MLAIQAPMPVYQTSLQPSCVTATVTDDPYAPPRARNGSERFIRAESVISAVPPHVAGGKKVAGSGGSGHYEASFVFRGVNADAQIP